jgi:hypothetical protein
MTAIKSIGFTVAGVILGLLIAAVAQTATPGAGAVYELTAQYFYEGIFAGKTNQFAVESDGDVTTTGDVTISGGQLNVPTVANATSSAVVGCVQLYATSSATAVKLDLILSASTTVNGATSAFVVAGRYGTCP